MAKRPRDPNQLAKMIVDIATGEVEKNTESPKKRATSVKGRSGGLKGGAARAETLTPRQKTEIATIAANARWKKK